MTVIEPSDKQATRARIRDAFARHPNKSAVARALKVSRSTLANWANGDVSPPAEVMPALADALGEDLEWLMWGRGTARANRLPALEATVAEQAKELAALRDAVAALETRLVPLEKADQADARARRRGRGTGA
jgi:transcriptional regulator with XRE-family HTH domain